MKYLMYALSAVGGFMLVAGAAQAQTISVPSTQDIFAIIGPVVSQADLQDFLDQIASGMPISQIGTPIARSIKCEILASIGTPIPGFATECTGVPVPTPGDNSFDGNLSGTVTGDNNLTGTVQPGSSLTGTVQPGNTLTGTVAPSCPIPTGNTLTGTVQPGNSLTGTVQSGNTLTGTVQSGSSLTGTVQPGNTLTGTVSSGNTLTGTVQPCNTITGTVSGGGSSGGGGSGGGGGGTGGNGGGGVSVPPVLGGGGVPPGEVQGASTGPRIPNTGAGGGLAATLGLLTASLLMSAFGGIVLRRVQMH